MDSLLVFILYLCASMPNPGCILYLSLGNQTKIRIIGAEKLDYQFQHDDVF